MDCFLEARYHMVEAKYGKNDTQYTPKPYAAPMKPPGRSSTAIIHRNPADNSDLCKADASDEGAGAGAAASALSSA